jgi:hypothetical protein
MDTVSTIAGVLQTMPTLNASVTENKSKPPICFTSSDAAILAAAGVTLAEQTCAVKGDETDDLDDNKEITNCELGRMVVMVLSVIILVISAFVCIFSKIKFYVLLFSIRKKIILMY